MRMRWRWGAVLLLSACGFGSQTLEELDPAAIPPDPTYAENIAPMMDYYCAACHDKDGQVGALEGIDVSNYNDVVDDYDDIEESIFQDKFMPPANARQLTARDLAILQRWAENGFPE